MAIGLLMDVHVNVAITQQLRRRGVSVVTAQEDQSAQFTDDKLLERAAQLGRVVFTNDIRFHALAEDLQRQGTPFHGLIFAHPMHCTIGQCVSDLEIIAKATEPSDWPDTVMRLPL
jgi:hypothetical protein